MYFYILSVWVPPEAVCPLIPDLLSEEVALSWERIPWVEWLVRSKGL